MPSPLPFFLFIFFLLLYRPPISEILCSNTLPKAEIYYVVVQVERSYIFFTVLLLIRISIALSALVLVAEIGLTKPTLR